MPIIIRSKNHLRRSDEKTTPEFDEKSSGGKRTFSAVEVLGVLCKVRRNASSPAPPQVAMSKFKFQCRWEIGDTQMGNLRYLSPLESLELLELLEPCALTPSALAPTFVWRFRKETKPGEMGRSMELKEM